MARFCKNCGKKLSFLAFFTNETLCKECKRMQELEQQKIEAERLARFTQVKEEILTTRTVSEQQIAFLKNQEKPLLLKLYSDLYDQFVLDKELEEQEMEILKKIQEVSNLTNEDVKFDERIRPYIYVSAIRKGENLPTIDPHQVEMGSPVILKKGEIVHFASSASLKELKSVSLGYSGESNGISIRIAKGITYRVGAHRGHIIKEDRFVETSQGILLITNQRLFLYPFPGHKPVNIPLDKILSYQCFDNGIEVYKNGREKSYFFAISKSASVEIFGICLGHLLGVGK